MARRRRVSLIKRLIVRPVKTRIRKRRAARKRQKVAAARMWTPVAKDPAKGRKVPRAQGGGRIQTWEDLGVSAEDQTKTKAALAAQNKPPKVPKAKATAKPKRPPKAVGPGFRVTTIEHGTNAGYHAHRARRSPACPSCLAAHAAYNRGHQ